MSNSSLAEIEDLAGKLDETPHLLEARVVLGLIRDLRKHLERGLSLYKVLLPQVVGSQDLIRTSDMTRRDAVNSIRPRALAEINGAQFLPLLRHFMPLEELGNFEKPRGAGLSLSDSKLAANGFVRAEALMTYSA